MSAQPSSPHLTLIDRLAKLAAQVEDALERLAPESCLGHSKDAPHDGRPMTIMGSGARPLFWQPLSTVGLLAQDDAARAYRRLWELGQFVLRHGSPGGLQRFESNDRILRLFIDQVDDSPIYDVPDILDRCKRALRYQLEALASAGFRESIGCIFVPDTMAMLNLTQLAILRDPGIHTTVMLVPSVLRELDRLKVARRNPGLTQKATAAIKRIKEFRRRGNLLIGVKESDRVRVQAVATEPSRQQYLSWLDPENDDDRLIASTLHVAALNCSSWVYILTADINLQNKAFFAEIPFLDSEELIQARTKP